MSNDAHMELVFINPREPDAAYSGDWIDGICRNFGMSDRDAYKVRTCVVEAVNNALEHGAAESITVRARPTIGRLSVEVSSSGPAAEPMLEVGPASAGIDPLSERGRGMAIIHAWMDSVHVERRGTRNVMCMAKRAGGTW